jgi:hypothetical protein
LLERYHLLCFLSSPHIFKQIFIDTIPPYYTHYWLLIYPSSSSPPSFHQSNPTQEQTVMLPFSGHCVLFIFLNAITDCKWLLDYYYSFCGLLITGHNNLVHAIIENILWSKKFKIINKWIDEEWTNTESVYRPEDNYIVEKSNRWRVKIQLQKLYINLKTTI